MILPVTLGCAGGLAFVALWLAVRVGQVRRASGIGVGDGGHDLLVRRMRAQANFTESVPFALALIALLEAANGASTWLWAASGALLVARVLHAFGMDGWRPGRTIGFAVTALLLAVLGAQAVATAWRAEHAAARPRETTVAFRPERAVD